MQLQNKDLEAQLDHASLIAEDFPDSTQSILFSIITAAQERQLPLIEMRAHFLVAKIARVQGDSNKAFQYLQNTEKIAYETEATNTVVDVLCEKGFVYKNIRRMPDSAAILFEKAGNIAKVVNYPHGDITSGMALSYLKMDQGQYVSAMETLLNLQEKYQNNSTPNEYGSLVNNIGHTYLQLGMYPEAIEQFKEAAIYFEQGTSDRLKLLAQVNLAETYFKAEELEQSLALIEKIETEIQGRPNAFIRNITVQIKGDIFLEKNEYEKALEIFNSELQQNAKRNFSIIYKLTIGKAKALWGLNKFQKAHNLALEAVNTSLSNKKLPLIELLSGYKILSESFKYLNDPKNALTYANLYQEGYAKIYSEKNRSNIYRTEVNNRIRLQKEQAKLESDLLKEQIKTEQREAIILIIILVFLVAGVIVAVVRYIQKNKLSSLLEFKNKELDKSKAEIEKKNKELELKNKALEASHTEIGEQNEQLEFTNEMIVSINESLEKLIKSRAKEITKKDEVLQEYAFINAHKLRAPVARILGLAKLFNHTESINDKEELVKKINYEVRDLDRIVLTITNTILKGENPERKDLEEGEEK